MLNNQTNGNMKAYTIKNHSGEKHLIINDISKVDVLDLFKLSRSLNVRFSIKQENGIQCWGLFSVAEYLGIKDVSKLLNQC